MTSNLKFRPFIVVAVLVLMHLSPTADGTVVGQQTSGVSKKSLAVDVVGLTGGRKIHGIVVADEAANPLQMLVERKWLEVNQPKLYQQALVDEQQSATTTRKTLIERLDRWIAERSKEQKVEQPDPQPIIGQNGDELLIEFLTDERDRIANEQVEQVADRLFVRLELDRNEVLNVYRQSPQRQNVAGLAWQHGLEQVSTSSLKALQKELAKQDIDSNTTRFELAEQIPVTLDSPRTWAARQALVEIRYREPLEFQGTTDHLVRLEEQPDIAQLMSGILGSAKNQLSQLNQLGADLGLPEFKQANLKIEQQRRQWWKPATDVAEQENFQGVLISRMLPIQEDRVTVEISVFAKMPGGQWEPVVQRYGTGQLAEVQPEDIERIQNDPQVQRVTRTLQLMGLDAGNELLEKAIRVGAATDTALKQAQGEFSSFSLDSTRKINSPIWFR